MANFVSTLHLECLPGVKIKNKPWKVLREFVYRTDLLRDADRIVVPAGYRTDFASVPRILWRAMPPGGRYREAAVVHDWLCDVDPKLCSSGRAAEVFKEAMKVLGVKKAKRNIMCIGVKWFGPHFKKGDTA